MFFKLLQVRAANPALYGGKRINLAKSATLYVDLKQTVNEQVVYLLNTGTTDTTYDLSTAGPEGHDSDGSDERHHHHRPERSPGSGADRTSVEGCNS